MATVPPVAALTAWLDQAREKPIIAAVLVLGYECVLLVGGMVAKIFEKLQEKWIDRAADRSDRFVLRLLARYGRVYRYYVRTLHHAVDIRGLSTQGDYAFSINDVFVDVNLVATAAHALTGQILDPARPEAIPAADAVRQSLWDVMGSRTNHVLAVLGAPGGGKTTLLRHVTLELAGRQPTRQLPQQLRRKLPILLFLREHAETIVENPETALADLVRATLKRFTRTEPPGWIDARLEKGQCIVMLDGLDEVAQPGHRAAVVRWVESQIAQYPANRFIVTSRPHGYQSRPLHGADVVRVLPFTDDQVGRFINNWYRATEFRRNARRDVGVREQATARATDLLRRIRDNPGLSDLAVNPLLLTMIAHVHLYRGALPGSRLALYREICEVFLGKRDEGKGLVSDLTADQKQIVLQSLAFAMMRGGTRDILTADAVNVLREPLSSVAGDADPLTFLRSLEQGSGLIAEQEPGTWRFAHLTFQEYLASVYIRDQNLGATLTGTITDDWWREVTLLYVAQTEADEVVRACLAAPADRVAALALAADCVDAARQTAQTLRAEVEQALSVEGTADPQRRIEVAQVFLARRERHAHRTRSGSRIFATPVSEIEWDLFRSGHYPRDDAAPRDAARPSPAPVLGLRSREAVSFEQWAAGLGSGMRLPEAGVVADLLRSADKPLGVQCVWATGSGGRPRIVHALDPIPAMEWAAIVEETLQDDAVILSEMGPKSGVAWFRGAARFNLAALPPPRQAMISNVPDYHPASSAPPGALRELIKDKPVVNALDLDKLYEDLWNAFSAEPALVRAPGRPGLSGVVCMAAEVLLNTPTYKVPLWAYPRLRAWLLEAAEMVRPMQDRGNALTRLRTSNVLEAAISGFVELTLRERRWSGQLPPTEGLVLADPAPARPQAARPPAPRTAGRYEGLPLSAKPTESGAPR